MRIDHSHRATPAAELLHRAGAGLSEVSRLVSSGDPEDIHRCRPALEQVRTALGAFQAKLGQLPATEKEALAGQAEELRESLEVFAALMMQAKAYFDSLAAELSRGRVTYGRTSARAFAEADMEVALMDL